MVLRNINSFGFNNETNAKRILFLLHVPPPVHGSSMMGQYIKESQIINSAFNCRFINLSTSKKMDEIGRLRINKFFRYINILGAISRQLVAFRPQYCYMAITIKGTAFGKDAFIALMIKLFGIKLIYHFHNKGVSSMQHKFLYNLFYKIVLKNEEVILLSKYLYTDVQKYVVIEKVHYCPNGIPESNEKENFRLDDIRQAELYKGNSLSSRMSNVDSVQILFLSNLIKSKGVYVLLEACSLLKKKQLSFSCTIVGGEGDINAIILKRKINEMGLSDKVNYIGKKYGSEKEKIYAQMDIFVFPTYYHNECFPLVLLEAMQHQIPVVSTYEGGICSIVNDGETGFLVPQENVHMLAEKIEQLIKNPNLRNLMGAASRAKYEKEFTLQAFENRLTGILNKIILKHNL